MKKFAAVMVVAMLLLQPAFAMDLPKAPAGFAWQEVPELKAAILKPDRWFFRREEGTGTLAYFITKEEIVNGSQFQTGLTVNVFRGLAQGTAAARGQALVEKMASEHGAQTLSHRTGLFREFSSEFKDTDATGTTMMHVLTIANTQTDTLYLLIFESPAGQWDAVQKTGEMIVDSLTINEGV